MSIPYRQSDGSKIRVSFAAEGFTKLSDISYDFNNIELAKKENELYNSGHSLFQLKEEVINDILKNHLYPVYYLINFDKKIIYSDPVDFVKFSNTPIDIIKLETEIELQIFNNIIFMVGNSSQFNDFFRSVWDKIMDCYASLAEENYRVLKIILRKLGYNENMIEEYIEILENYIITLYKKRINESMTKEKVYSCHKYMKSLKKSYIKEIRYINIKEMVNSFLCDSLIEKIDEFKNSGYCRDVFEESYFANEILEIDSIAEKEKIKLVNKIFEYYNMCLELRLEEKQYYEAQKCYELIIKNEKYFDYPQRTKLKEYNTIILNNIDQDPVVKSIKKNKIKSNVKHKLKEILVVITILDILMAIIMFIVSLVTVFNNSVTNLILVVNIVFLIIAYYLDKLIDKY